MLHEFNHPGTVEGNLIRRWFSDEFFDLFVWFDKKRAIVSFQLCYNKSRDEHSFTWKAPSSYHHQRVDDGENRPGKNKSTPILLPDGSFNFAAILRRFKAESESVDKDIAAFVEDKLKEYGQRAVA
jgi:hypothetical protein